MCERFEFWQNMAMGILMLGVIRTCFYEECPEKKVDDFYYDCEDDDLHDEKVLFDKQLSQTPKGS